MPRRSVVLLSFLLLACGKPSRSPEEMLPLEVQGWKRGDVAAVTPLPDGAVAAGETLYLGEGRVTVRAVQFPSETVAFEKMQRWRQSDGLAAYKGAWLFVANPGPGATTESAMPLLSALKDQGTR